MATGQANSDSNQNTGSLIGEAEAGLSDFLNATATATSGISGSSFGLHTTNVTNNGGLFGSIGLGKLVVFAGLTFAGYWLYKKMKRR